MYRIYLLIGCVVASFLGVFCQENAGPHLPNSIEECYKNLTLFQRENRYPMDLKTFIAIVRKIETNPVRQPYDAKTLSLELLHRFRMDGIIRDVRIMEHSENVIPYAPEGEQKNKYKILLENLLPGNAFNFPNETLTGEERCALHFMLSDSVEEYERGSEGSDCNSLQPGASANRIRRSVETSEMNEDVADESPRIGKLSHDGTSGKGDPRTRGTYPGVKPEHLNIQTSACPVENGVVDSRQGAISLGDVIAGIAAGLQPNNPSVTDLLRRGADARNLTRAYDPVQSVFAATLAGQIAEVAVYQGPQINSGGQLTVGADGGWNITTDRPIPQWYFINNQNGQQHFEATAAELRGAVDGLLLGQRVYELNSQVSSLKLSNILEWYYSDLGIPDQNSNAQNPNARLRACDRVSQFGQRVDTNTLNSQAVSFSQVLYDKSISIKISEESVQNFASSAAGQAKSVIGSLQASTQSSCYTATNDNLPVEPNVDLYLVVDWTAESQMKTLLYVLTQYLEIRPGGIGVTIINGGDGTFIVNRTDTILDIVANVTSRNDQPWKTGIDLQTVLIQLKSYFDTQMEDERQRRLAVSNATVVAFISYNTIDETYKENARKMFIRFKEENPDVTFLYMVGSASETLKELVYDANKDIMQLTTGNNWNVVNQLQTRLRELPNRLLGPTCGALKFERSSDQGSTDDYVVGGQTKAYRIHPAYFFNSENFKIRIQSDGRSTLTVCTSRKDANPSNSSSSSGSNSQCKDIASGSTQDYPFSCSTDYLSECQPGYITVKPTVNAPCTEILCPRPDAAKVTITSEGATCASGVVRMVFNHITILAALFTVLLSYNRSS